MMPPPNSEPNLDFLSLWTLNCLTKDVRIWKDGKEDSPLDSKSSYWMQIRMVGKDETIPQNDGYFEIELPKVFFEENPKSFTVDWIDFYR